MAKLQGIDNTHSSRNKEESLDFDSGREWFSSQPAKLREKEWFGALRLSYHNMYRYYIQRIDLVHSKRK